MWVVEYLERNLPVHDLGPLGCCSRDVPSLRETATGRQDINRGRRGSMAHKNRLRSAIRLPREGVRCRVWVVGLWFVIPVLIGIVCKTGSRFFDVNFCLFRCCA
ncbi:hypothetical protein M3J09_008156 [Ascochyta lentis]